MKLTAGILILVCFPGLISGQAIRYKKDVERIALRENQILLNATVSEKPAAFILDLGTAESTLADTIRSKNQKYLIESNLFSSMKSFSKTATPDGNCKSPPISGRIGYDFFRKSQKVFKLDFDEPALAVTDEPVEKEYQEIKSDFRADGIYITVMLKWKTYQLKFDTGYSGTIFMSDKDAARFIREACKDYESLDGNYAVYPNKWITINGNYYNAPVTVANRGVSRIGMGFLKGFNWIIDFRRHKVYLRKNSISLDAQNVFPPDYIADIQNGRLKITTKHTKAKQFQLGEAIEMVNGIRVTAENICEMKALLSATPNWDMLNIQSKAR